MIRNRTCLHLDENNCDGHSIEAKYCLQLPCPLSQGNIIFNNSCTGLNLTLNLYITPFALCCTIFFFFFFNVGPPKKNIFLTTFYSLYFNQGAHLFAIKYKIRPQCPSLVNFLKNLT